MIEQIYQRLKALRWNLRLPIAYMVEIMLRITPLINPYYRRKVLHKIYNSIVINVRGIKFYLVDFHSLWVVASQEHEPWMWYYIINLIKPGSVFVDVGAHIGKYTLAVAKRLRNKGLVISIEPEPENFRSLIANLYINGLNPYVVALNVAAWSRDSIIKLHIGASSGGHSTSFIKSRKRESEVGKTILVKAKRIDDIVKKLRVHRIDLVKIDVEGAEYDVLLGMKECLERFKPDLIIEVHRNNDRMVKEFLEQRGYKIYDIKEAFYNDHYYIFCRHLSKVCFQ